MFDSRTRRQRQPATVGRDGHGARRSILGMLMNYLADRVARSAMLRVKREAQKVVRLTILRLILGALGATLLTGGFFYLFQAEVKGLDALCCPPWLAYLSTGVSAILLALMAMKGILWPREEDESD